MMKCTSETHGGTTERFSNSRSQGVWRADINGISYCILQPDYSTQTVLTQQLINAGDKPHVVICFISDEHVAFHFLGLVETKMHHPTAMRSRESLHPSHLQVHMRALHLAYGCRVPLRTRGTLLPRDLPPQTTSLRA